MVRILRKRKKPDIALEQKGNKKIKVDKLVEVIGEDSSEDTGGKARRRFGRLAKSQARYKQKSIRYPVEEDSSGNNSDRREEEDISNSKKDEGNEEGEKNLTLRTFRWMILKPRCLTAKQGKRRPLMFQPTSPLNLLLFVMR